MRNKKIKVFLAGYVNLINAQNINCRALSLYLNKDKFEISTMKHWYQDAHDFQTIQGVKYIKLRRPGKIWRYFVYLKGIANAKVAYLPKGEIDGFCNLIAKIFGTKIFTTVEGVLDSILENRIGKDKFPHYVNHFRRYNSNNLYPITKFIRDKERSTHNLPLVNKVLYLGVNSDSFLQKKNNKEKSLKNIIFIGNDPIRKNVYDIFEAASLFPDIVFNLVGGNSINEGKIEDYIKEKSLKNVKYHGRLDQTQLSKLLQNMDLMFFPSRSEGFPKVHLEAACSGVPTLCYSDYGAREWISSWNNGIVVDKKEEAFDAIKKIQENPDLLRELSENAIFLGKKFDWKNVIEDWENVIEELAQ